MTDPLSFTLACLLGLTLWKLVIRPLLVDPD